MGPAFSRQEAGGCQELGEVTAAVVLADSLEASEAAASRVSTCVLLKQSASPSANGALHAASGICSVYPDATTVRNSECMAVSPCHSAAARGTS